MRPIRVEWKHPETRQVAGHDVEVASDGKGVILVLRGDWPRGSMQQFIKACSEQRLYIGASVIRVPNGAEILVGELGP